MNKQKKFSKAKKKFLSDHPYEHGSVSYYVRYDPDDENDIVNASLRIADCSEDIQLSFTVNKVEHYKKRLKKLDTLIDVLMEMREALTSKEIAERVAAKKKSIKNKSLA